MSQDTAEDEKERDEAKAAQLGSSAIQYAFGGLSLNVLGLGFGGDVHNDVASLAAGLYEHFQPAGSPPLARTGAYAHVVPMHVDINANCQKAYDFFVKCGWSSAQSIGIVANLMQESSCNPHGVAGDSGTAEGLCQWHADRRENYEVWARQNHFANCSFESSTFEQQLGFINYELTQGKEQKAGRLLRAAKDPREAAQIFSTYDERPKRREYEEQLRAGKAADLANRLTTASADTPVADAEHRDDPKPVDAASENLGPHTAVNSNVASLKNGNPVISKFAHAKPSPVTPASGHVTALG